MARSAVASKLIVLFGADTKDAEKEFKKFQRELKQLGSDLTQIGSRLSIGLTAPIAALGVKAVQASDDFGKVQNALVQLREIGNRALIDLGNDLVRTFDIPAIIEKFASGVRAVTATFQSLPPVVKATVFAVGLLAAALGPVLFLTGQIITVSAVLLKYLGVTPVAAAAAAGSLALLGGALVLLTGGIVEAGGAMNFLSRVALGSIQAMAFLAEQLGKLGASAGLESFAELARKAGQAVADIEREFAKLDKDRLSTKLAELDVELKKLKTAADGTKVGITDFGASTDAASDPIRRMLFGLEQNAQMVQTFGQRTEFAAERVSLLRRAIEGIRSEHQGIIPEERLEKLRELIALLRQAETEQQRIAAANQESLGAWEQWAAGMQNVSQQFSQATLNIYQSLVQGIGNAVAQTVVYTENLAAGGMQILKQVAAEVVSTLVQLGINLIISALVQKTALASTTTATLASKAAETYAGVFAGYATTIPIVGAALGAVAATAAVAGMLGGAAVAGASGAAVGAGIAALATGAIVTRPTLAVIGEGSESEAVLPLSKLQALLDDRGAGGTVGHVYLDGRELANSYVRWLPRVLGEQGISA